MHLEDFRNQREVTQRALDAYEAQLRYPNNYLRSGEDFQRIPQILI